MGNRKQLAIYVSFVRTVYMSGIYMSGVVVGVVRGGGNVGYKFKLI